MTHNTPGSDQDESPSRASFGRWTEGVPSLSKLATYLSDQVSAHAGASVRDRPGRFRDGAHLRAEAVDRPLDLGASERGRILDLLVRTTLTRFPSPFEGHLRLEVWHGVLRSGVRIPVHVGLSDSPAMVLSHWRKMAKIWKAEAHLKSRSMDRMFGNTADVIHASAGVIRAARPAKTTPTELLRDPTVAAQLLRLANEAGVGPAVKALIDPLLGPEHTSAVPAGQGPLHAADQEEPFIEDDWTNSEGACLCEDIDCPECAEDQRIYGSVQSFLDNYGPSTADGSNPWSANDDHDEWAGYDWSEPPTPPWRTEPKDRQR